MDLSAVSGFDLAIDSDVPMGAGLASSAALEAATALALSQLWGLDLDRITKVGEAVKAAFAPVGYGAPEVFAVQPSPGASLLV